MSCLVTVVNMIKALIKGQTLAIKSSCVGQGGPCQDLQCVFDEERWRRSPATHWKSPSFVLAVILTQPILWFFGPVKKVLLSKIQKMLQQQYFSPTNVEETNGKRTMFHLQRSETVLFLCGSKSVEQILTALLLLPKLS